MLGAGVYPDGRLSDALTDRMRTAVELYRGGYVKTLVLSGGPGMGEVHETQAMRQYAISHGVPQEYIVIDEEGLSTRRTAESTVALFDSEGAHRILAISHFYHLPRVKLAYQQLGWDIYTIPAKAGTPSWDDLVLHNPRVRSPLDLLSKCLIQNLRLVKSASYTPAN